MATEKKTPAVEEDPWQVKKEITLPRSPKNEQNFRFVGVNGRTFQVPRDGKPHEVPMPVYEVLVHAAEIEDYAAERSEEMSQT